MAESYDECTAARASDVQARYDGLARSLPPLDLGTQVRIQDTVSKRWDKVGVILGVVKSRDYHIKLPSGRVLWRNRRFLRPTQFTPDELLDAPGSAAPSPPPTPRRSPRIEKRKSSVQDSS